MAAQGNSGTSPIGELLKRLGEMSERIGSINQSVHQLFLAFRQLGELSRRFAIQLMTAVGAPRFVRGDAYHFLTGGGKGKGGHGGGSSSYTPKTAEERMAEILKEHEYRQQLKAADHEADRKYFDELEGYKTRKEEAKWRGIKDRGRLDEYSTAALAQEATSPASRNPAGAKVDPVFAAMYDSSRWYAINHLGVDPKEIPPANPANPHTRDWMHQVQKLTNPDAAPSAGAPPARVPPKYPGSASTPAASGGAKKGGWLDSLQNSAQQLSHIFLGLASVSQELVKSASPDTYETFTKSLELLAGSIGQYLIPFFLQLSQAAQDLAGWFRDLSPLHQEATKVVAKWALLSVGVTALLALFATLGTELTAVLLILTALGVTLEGLNRQLGLLDKLIPKPAGPQANELSRGELEKSSGVQAVLDIAGLRHGRSKGEPSDDEIKAAAEEVRAAKMTGVENLKKQAAQLMDEAGLSGQKPPSVDAQGNLTDKGLEAFNSALKASAATDKGKYLEAGLKAEKAGRVGTEVSQIDEWLARKYGGKPEPSERPGQGVSRLLMAFSSVRGNAQYMPVEQAYKRTQLAALGDDPLTAEIKKMQLQYLEKYLSLWEKNGNKLDSLIDYFKMMFGS